MVNLQMCLPKCVLLFHRPRNCHSLLYFLKGHNVICCVKVFAPLVILQLMICIFAYWRRKTFRCLPVIDSNTDIISTALV